MPVGLWSAQDVGFTLTNSNTR